jgi:L-arabinokinase
MPFGILQSHYSYSRCGLGSHGTDRLVGLVKQSKQKAQPDGATLFGAKITGGGCGGTVCVLGRAGSRSSDQILKVTSYSPHDNLHCGAIIITFKSVGRYG